MTLLSAESAAVLATHAVPLRPTPGGWMHQQLLAQANGFGGHEYPFSDSNPLMHNQNRYYPFANYSGSVNK